MIWQLIRQAKVNVVPELQSASREELFAQISR